MSETTTDAHVTIRGMKDGTWTSNILADGFGVTDHHESLEAAYRLVYQRLRLRAFARNMSSLTALPATPARRW